MHWTYQGEKVEEIPEGVEAFVYLITNTTNNMKYVGKKLAKFKTTKPPLKGKKIKDVERKNQTGKNTGVVQINFLKMLHN